MTRLSSMPTPSFFSLQRRAHQLKSAAFSPLPAFTLGGIADRISAKSPFSDSTPCSPDRIKKISTDDATTTDPRSMSVAPGFMMHIIIDAGSVTRLRQVVMVACGDLVGFMRIQPIAHATKMKVWLCLSKPAVDLIMSAVMQNLPNAEFGKIGPA